MYKRGSSNNKNRGQVTLFIIIGIVVVAVVLLAIFLVPKVTQPKTQPGGAMDPGAYVSSCVNDELEPIVETLSNQSGYLNVTGNGIVFENVFRRYLCYTSQYYFACVDQEPLLKEKVEETLKAELIRLGSVSKCVNNFVENAKTKGYEITSCSTPSFSIKLVNGRINIPIICQMSLTKGEEIKRFENVTASLSWPLYDFIMVSKDIINDEKVGYFNDIVYMMGHQWIEIEKNRISNADPLYDGSIVYILRERSTGKTFAFAVRSKVLPRGPM